MIGIVPDKRKDGKSSFRDLIGYCTDQPSRVAHSGFQNLLSAETAAIEMEALAGENRRCMDPVFHAILSWREFEAPTDGQVDEAVRIALREFGLQDCQALWALYNDTENLHVHIAVNRIDPETHRAVQPADNWTHRAIQRAARKTELAQGWEVEQHGTYLVTTDGRLVEKQNPERRFSQAALDIEAHTAEKSAERIGREIAAPILREAKSWDGLHEKLAARGIAFERKGSGALLRVGDTLVKASKIGRDLSFSKLVQRLGDFTPGSADLVVADRVPEPVERVSERGLKAEWERYTEARQKYFEEKKESREALQQAHRQERTTLLNLQRGERQALFSVSWAGRGRELNGERSLLAAKQQREKLDLGDRQKREREDLKRSFPARFPNFKRWLSLEKDPKLLNAWRYQGNPVLHGGGETDTRPLDLRDWTPSRRKEGSVFYSRDNGDLQESRKSAFIDYGKRIVMPEHCDLRTVVAAMQLAAQKWGAIWVEGAEGYRNLCVEAAAQYGLKIANPDLQEKVGRRKEAIRTEQIYRELFERYATAIGNEASMVETPGVVSPGATRFRILVTGFTANGTRAFIPDQRRNEPDGMARWEVLLALPRMAEYAAEGKNINIVPLSPDRHHILVDDLTQESLHRLREDGYMPACVIESSPGSFQAILNVPVDAGSEKELEREAANKLTRDLNKKYGDPNLSGAVHAHRLPPFPNCKPKHRRADGSFPATRLVEAGGCYPTDGHPAGGLCEKCAAELAGNRERIRERTAAATPPGGKWRHGRGTNGHGPNGHDPNGYETGGSDPTGAYWAHYRDIAAKYKKITDYSRIDAMIGIRMRVTGYDAGQVRAAIEVNAPAMRKETLTAGEYDAKYRNRNWKRYAGETTAKFVFGPRGAAQFSGAEPYRPLYMRIEGRGSFTARRQPVPEREAKERGMEHKQEREMER